MMRIRVATLALLLALQSLANAGENEWTYVGLYPERVTDIVVHPNDPNILYVSAFDVFYDTTREGGIFKTTDHGLTWDTMGFRHYRVNDLAFDPQHPETLWAACGMFSWGEVNGAFRSTDGGSTWERRSEGLYLGGPTGLGVTSIAVSPFDSDLLVCTGANPEGYGWVSRTTNGGELWTEVDVRNNGYKKVVFDSLFLGRIFVLETFLEVLWVSEDSGATFRTLPAADYIDDYALDPFRRNWLWTISLFSFLYSRDAGSTWVEPDSSFPPDPYWGQFVRVSPDRMNTVYATTLGRVFQTEDAGATWLEFVEGWPTHARTINAISIVASSPTELWAGLKYHGILSYTAVDTSSIIESSGPQALRTNLELYPNPATNILYLSISSGPFSGTFSLYNILGQRVLSIPFSQPSGLQAVHLPQTLPSGTYFGSLTPLGQSRTLPTNAHPVIIVK